MLWGTNLTSVEARNDPDADLVKTSLLFQCTNGLQIGINNIVRKGPWVFEFTGQPAHAKIIVTGKQIGRASCRERVSSPV